MSFILDALKKSENARQRQSGPGFADVPVAQPKTRQPWWVFAVAALLLVNLLVLLFVLLRVEPEPPAQPVRTVAPAPAPAVPPASTAPGQSARTVAAPPGAAPAPAASAPASVPVDPVPAPRTQAPARSLAEAAGLDEPYADDDPTLAYEAIDTVAARVPTGPPIVQPLPDAARRADEPAETLPTVNDLALSGGVSLPEMHLDIHVFAPVPAERFVFINMRKYVEGQKLQEGPVVERITRDGVVLNQQGLRFLLPSQ